MTSGRPGALGDRRRPPPGTDCSHGVPRATRRPSRASRKPDPILVADGVRRCFGGARRGRRRPPRGPARSHHRAHRPQRRGQDHVVQPAHRLRPAGHRHVASSTVNALAGVPGPQGGARSAWCARSSSPRPCPAVRAREHEAGRHGQRGESFLRAPRPGRWRAQEAEIEARADDLLDRFGMAHMPRRVRRLVVGRSAQAARDGRGRSWPSPR